ncbi:NADAR family protein [Candidatus Mycosynbacter amalyticus]|nr:NADAR family protein [Candidatus Mycosynbacter amalyticus]
MMAVEKFRGKYFPFSNMYPLTEWIRADCGVLVPTSEHAYMSARFRDPVVQLHVANARATDESSVVGNGRAAKERAYWYIDRGASLLVSDETAKIALMKRVVARKLQANPEIQSLLKETGDEDIYEGNDWGDNFWGVSPVGSRHGKNNLGKILMELRTCADG